MSNEITAQSWFNQPMQLQNVAANIDLLARVTDAATVTYQFIAIDTDAPDKPPTKTQLFYGRDEIKNRDGWYFNDVTETKYFLHNFSIVNLKL